MDELQRLGALEVTVRYERERTDYHLAGLHSRIQRLEENPITRATMGMGGWFKILLALFLPLLVLLATGDLRQAVNTLRLGGG